MIRSYFFEVVEYIFYQKPDYKNSHFFQGILPEDFSMMIPAILRLIEGVPKDLK